MEFKLGQCPLHLGVGQPNLFADASDPPAMLTAQVAGHESLGGPILIGYVTHRCLPQADP